MESIKIKSVKVAPVLPLDKIVELLGTPMKFRWDEYITLSGNELDLVLKYNTENKHVYIFKYGCISFANFEDDEIYTFIKYIESFGSKINYSLLYKYYEIHYIKVLPNQKINLWQNSNVEYDYSDTLIHVTSIILAKSTELSSFESDLNMLLDDAEKFITYLQKGRLGFYRKKSSVLISKMLRFEYDSIHSIRILDRPGFVEQTSELRDIYDIISKYYELDERLSVVNGKIDSLHDLLDLYSNLSFKQTENRLILFEIFLLALFPVFHLFEHILETGTSLGFLTNLLK
ncbi:RMD1 family protein [Acetivibrio cellulolyticus]|uniref:RMD1 family protein n=1 Tax=Acetivibrio cellulolyticus TaxID=35830 RepID=UPI0001E2FB19|nr:RMD1 family protein [Acetivibrio cellulolyticus]